MTCGMPSAPAHSCSFTTYSASVTLRCRCCTSGSYVMVPNPCFHCAGSDRTQHGGMPICSFANFCHYVVSALKISQAWQPTNATLQGLTECNMAVCPRGVHQELCRADLPRMSSVCTMSIWLQIPVNWIGRRKSLTWWQTLAWLVRFLKLPEQPAQCLLTCCS